MNIQPLTIKVLDLMNVVGCRHNEGKVFVTVEEPRNKVSNLWLHSTILVQDSTHGENQLFILVPKMGGAR